MRYHFRKQVEVQARVAQSQGALLRNLARKEAQGLVGKLTRQRPGS